MPVEKLTGKTSLTGLIDLQPLINFLMKLSN